MPFAQAHDGVQLHYRIHDYTDPWKKAPVLILQHGFGRSSQFWYNLIPYLSRFYRVVCPDLRGLGESSRDFDFETGITVDNYLRDIISIADSLELENFHYAGESLGGMLGYALAANHPDRVRTLSLMSASLSLRADAQKAFAFDYPTWQDALRALGTKGWAAAANKSTRFPPDMDPQLMEWYSTEFGKTDVNILIAMSKVAVTLNLRPFLEKIAAPVLGLYPTGGAFAKSGEEQILKSTVRNIRMVHFPTTYHMVWVLAPAACAKHMLHFMATNDGIVAHES